MNKTEMNTSKNFTGSGLGDGAACILVKAPGLDEMKHPFWKWLAGPLPQWSEAWSTMNQYRLSR